MGSILKLSNVRKTVNYLKKNGITQAYYAARERMEEEKRDDYFYREPTEEALAAQRKETTDYPYVFSIVVPAYETGEEFLRAMIASVRNQSYVKWELIIADASNSEAVEQLVQQIAEETQDTRIKYVHLPENKGISGNTNAGIDLAEGDYIALLDHDDFITPDALYYMAAKIRESMQQNVMPALLYSDEDKFEQSTEEYVSPHEKQEFNLDLILSNNYICHFTAVEAKLMKKLKLREEYDGAQDYDLVLRVVDYLQEQACEEKTHIPCLPGKWQESIVHIPRVLYHWRCHADSTAENTASKAYAYEAGKAALASFCEKQGWNVTVGHSLHLGFYDIFYVPDILSVREDVGIVGGRILDRRGRICAGAYDEKGNCLFEGLSGHYSGGRTHRAVLKQECAAVDIRCMQLRTDLQAAFTQITGLPYQERTIRVKTKNGVQKERIADISGLVCDEAGYRKLSMELGRAVTDKGYRVLLNPMLTLKDSDRCEF